MARRYWNIDLEEMMEAGIHFGHGTRKWNSRMAPYISAKHKGIHITKIWRRQNCFKHRQNQKRPLFQREEDGLFTFDLMVRGELKAKQW